MTDQRFLRLLREGGWLLLAALGAYFALILIGYDPADPGWSRSLPATVIHNPGGRLGAWLADLWYFAFGWSALWWVALLGRGLLGWWRLRQKVIDGKKLDEALSVLWRWKRWITAASFLLWVVSSSALEYLRFHRLAGGLPQGAGGVIGQGVGTFVAERLGFVGGTLLLLALFLVGFSLFWGVSWGEVTEWVGARAERLWQRWRNSRVRPNESERGEEKRFSLLAVVQITVAEGVMRLRSRLSERWQQVIGLRDQLRAWLFSPWTKKESRLVPPAETGAEGVGHEVPNCDSPLQLSDLPAPEYPGNRVDRENEPALGSVSTQWSPLPTPEPVADSLSSLRASGDPVVASSQVPLGVDAAPITAKPRAASPAVPLATPPVVAEPTVPQRPPAVKAGLAVMAKPGDSILPPLTLLDQPMPQPMAMTPERIAATSQLIEAKLAEFGVRVTVVGAITGPVVTRFEIEPATGVKGAQIVNLAKDLARALSLVSIRVVEIVPGKSCMALEVPNPQRQIVRLFEVLDTEVYRRARSPLTVCLGKDIGGAPVVADLAKMPHLLVAGTTGSGKSVGINAMILSLLFKSDPSTVRLIMIDPKMLELSIYEGIPHLLAPVVTDMRLAAQALNWCVGEMERRYKLMAALGVRNIAGFNSLLEEAAREERYVPNPFSLSPEHPEPLNKMPYLVVVVDELADLMMVAGKKIEELIARLAQKARAAGIHLILATQRPSVDVITGLIKANVPTRIAFQVSSKVDSRTILDQMGAETLLGMGDMLYLAPGMGTPQRVHGAFVADDEVHRVVTYLKAFGPPHYVEAITADEADEEGGSGWDGEGGNAERDPLFDQAVEVVMRTRRPSISLVQRHLRIGYNRAARLIEAMEQAGLVSPPEPNGNRKVLVPERNEP